MEICFSLSSFGGAGGQHACEIAENLGISRILIHRYSSILSAYGLALAERVFETQEPSSTKYNSDSIPALTKQLDRLGESVSAELKKQGFASDKIRLDRMLNMRFDGTDTALMITATDDAEYEAGFKAAYKEQFGFVLDTPVVVDDVKVGLLYSSHAAKPGADLSGTGQGSRQDFRQSWRIGLFGICSPIDAQGRSFTDFHQGR